MAQTPQDPSLNLFMADTLPSDSRQARQLARRQLIVEAVMAEGAIRIEDITERFDISLMTAHRDIDELVERGLLHKSRGVVSATATSLVESSDIYRATRQLEEKQAIAEVAAGYLEPGQAIFLDDSTTSARQSAADGNHQFTHVDERATQYSRYYPARPGWPVLQLVQRVYGPLHASGNRRTARRRLFCQYVGGDGWDRFPPVGGDHRDQAGDV